MKTYRVRLTVEGAHEEVTVLAPNALAATRIALADNWRNVEPAEVVVAAREIPRLVA